MAKVHPRCVTTLDVGRKPSSGESWESFRILFHGFADPPSAVDQETRSPKFTCNGHEWCLCIYPGGDNGARGNTSVYLKLCSEGNVTASFEICVLDKGRRDVGSLNLWLKDKNFLIGRTSWGWQNCCSRLNILNRVDEEGTLAIIVSIKRDAASPFVPSNPMSGMITKMVTRMFLDEETADVCFEVSDVDSNSDDTDAAPSPVTFHAHSFVLKACAPMLASLFDSNEDEIATVSITDVKPAIFRHLLHYVYGGSVPDREMKTYAKDIINAADKYSIANLKLEAEAAYVKSTGITMDNAIENLLFAGALHLALLKEAVMDFLAENHDEAIKKVSFADVPGHLMKDLLVAFGRKNRVGANTGSDDDLSTMRVSELRWRLSELGLDVDGSREAMIEALGATSHGT